MTRRLLVEGNSGEASFFSEEEFADEAEIQNRLRSHPELLPFEDLGLGTAAVVVGMESQLATGRADLVMLTGAGELVIVEFKTGPENSDFRRCIAQLIDYGSALWGMTVDQFDREITRRFLASSYNVGGSLGASLADLMAAVPLTQDSVGWADRLQAQLRDGTFHFIAVAQRFTPAMQQTIRYLNETTRSRFAAVEMIRFRSGGSAAYEARVIEAGTTTVAAAKQAALSGTEAFLDNVADPDYKAELEEFLEGASAINGLQLAWGTVGCSLRVSIPRRNPFSVGWIFPPGQTGWLGLTNVTLGWYEDSNGLALTDDARAALAQYKADLAFTGVEPTAATIFGRTFGPSDVSTHKDALLAALQKVVTSLVESS